MINQDLQKELQEVLHQKIGAAVQILSGITISSNVSQNLVKEVYRFFDLIKKPMDEKGYMSNLEKQTFKITDTLENNNFEFSTIFKFQATIIGLTNVVKKFLKEKAVTFQR